RERAPLPPTTFRRVFAVRNCPKGQRNHRQHAHHVTRQTVHTRTPTYVLNDGPACFLIRMPCTPCPHGMQWVLTRLFFGGKHGRPRPAANGHCSPAGPLVLIPKLGLHRSPAIDLELPKGGSPRGGSSGPSAGRHLMLDLPDPTPAA